MSIERIEKGDIVTRDGTDEHLVYNINDPAYDLIDVVCIKNPSDVWTNIGETESNLTRRYSYVSHMVNWEESLKRMKVII